MTAMTQSAVKAPTEPGAGHRFGLAQGSWKIGQVQPDSPMATVHLMLETKTQHIIGCGQVTQSGNSMLNSWSKVGGDYSYLTVEPDSTHILVVGIGYPVNPHWPLHSSIPSDTPPNLTFRILLSHDWESGTGNFRYTGPDGKTVDIESATVEKINFLDIVGKA